MYLKFNPEYNPLKHFDQVSAFDVPIKNGKEYPPITVDTSIRSIDANVATKFDEGKRDWSLLPYDSVEEIVKVLEAGAKKYSRSNWQKGEGFKYSRSFNALQRHILAFMRGEDNDPETGLSHLSHAMCNLLFMQHFVLNKDKYKNCDDRDI